MGEHLESTAGISRAEKAGAEPAGPQSTKNPSSKATRIRTGALSYEVAQDLAARLEEINAGSIRRLVEIFGKELVVQKAEEALKLHAEAAERGTGAYTQAGSAVATGKSKPRTKGGVFFYLMRSHAEELGLDWYGLRVSPQHWSLKEKKSAGPAPVPATGEAEAVPVTAPRPENRPVARPGQNVATTPEPQIIAGSGERAATGKPGPADATPKVARLKATIVGSLVAEPRPSPNGQEGLVELRFKVRMGTSLPKGLPDLGESRVVVWCTRKQFDKLAGLVQLTPQTRYIIEGEAVPVVGSDFNPFMRILCTRLTTVELEESRRQS